MSFAKLKGYEHKARKMKFTAGAAYSAGAVIVVQGRVGVVFGDVANGDEGLMTYATDELGIDLPKATGAITKGAVVYWDADGDPIGGTSGAGAITTTATANIRCGRAAETVASGDAVVAVELIVDHVQQ